MFPGPAVFDKGTCHYLLLPSHLPFWVRGACLQGSKLYLIIRDHTACGSLSLGLYQIKQTPGIEKDASPTLLSHEDTDTYTSILKFYLKRTVYLHCSIDMGIQKAAAHIHYSENNTKSNNSCCNLNPWIGS